MENLAKKDCLGSDISLFQNSDAAPKQLIAPRLCVEARPTDIVNVHSHSGGRGNGDMNGFQRVQRCSSALTAAKPSDQPRYQQIGDKAAHAVRCEKKWIT